MISLIFVKLSIKYFKQQYTLYKYKIVTLIKIIGFDSHGLLHWLSSSRFPSAISLQSKIHVTFHPSMQHRLIFLFLVFHLTLTLIPNVYKSQHLNYFHPEVIHSLFFASTPSTSLPIF